MKKRYILFLILSILLSSCGTRKVEREKTSESSKIDTNKTERTVGKIETKTDVNLSVTKNETTNELEIIPVDNSKPMIIDGRSYTNARVKAKTNKSTTNTKQKKKELKNEEKTNVKTEKIKAVSNKDSNKKKSDRKSNNYFWILWLIIAIIIYLLYRFIKKRISITGVASGGLIG